ncbi:hypothetical protein GV794_17010 [Nocardia cyriacigeorgica]|uniref:Secreted protein n=1 Tax=Nocardia cyriacigeorgica TaxID=135487 RepID=A0A6P1DBG0_9NOCA|nr:hypothetical protein [Nocardia cyriacigeorgica]NEW39094.1 hypothetical protein [Nocardia cyriacigeorgica]NEW48066.1 hypothetical protein [Nocardia cyriacigeorgica]NEW52730.1 hypothetical protein [Nocardia cyriacigeorgica]NEW57342.1 hypothetical protein [Nocardia cyriacigeorgica]
MINQHSRFHAIRRAFTSTVTIGLLATSVMACGDTLTGSPLPGEIDVRNLDTGQYPTEPVDAHDDPIRAPFYDMKQVAGMRVADYVATADEIDPALKYTLEDQVTFEVMIESEFDRFGTDMRTIAETNRYLYAFASGGSSEPAYITQLSRQWPKKSEPKSTTLATIVLQFPDEDSAKLAAQQFHDRDLAQFTEKNRPVALDKYPGAHSHWNPESPFMRSTIAHGTYVVGYQISAPSNDLQALTSLTEKAYDTQLPLLDQLPPITDVQLLSLPWDPDRLVVRAMDPLNSGAPSLGDSSSSVGLRGILHVAPDRATARSSYKAMNAVRFGSAGDSIVVRTENDESARKAVTDKLFPFATTRSAAPPLNIPDSTCAETSEKYGTARFDRFVCMVAYHNYVGIVTSDQLVDVHQRAAAQYSILANAR